MTPESQPSNIEKMAEIDEHQCEYIDYATKERCTSTDTSEHSYPDDLGKVFSCNKHLQDFGFCKGCGGFWGGSEDFEMEPSGLCEDCKYQLDDADREMDEEDEWE